MKSPAHRTRDIERQAGYLKPEHCAPPPPRSGSGTMWFIRDGCGIVCGVITWFLVFYAEFVVVFVMLLPAKNVAYSLFNGVIFNGLAFLALASHAKAMCTDPGAVPKGNATKEFIESLQLKPGQVVYKCPKCCSIKPDRAHHCSVCKRCIKKMDHHCPWVNNCVGFSNYKFFLLFLSYSMLYCVFIAATVFQYFLKFWVGDLPNGPAKFHVLFLMFVALMFFVSLMFLFGYHCWLVAKNRSTLEAFSAPFFVSGPDRNGFNVGMSRNLQQVFGEDRRLWFIPVFTSQGNGHYFPLKNRSSESHNLLLASEDMWEESDDGSEEGGLVEDQDPSVTIEMEE